MKKIVIILFYVFISCNSEKKAKPEGSEEVKFTIENIDTLDSKSLNNKLFKYFNKENENKENRFVEVFYVIEDTMFEGELNDIKKYHYGGVTNVKTTQDTLTIDTFNLKGKKFLTVIVYDEIQLPVGNDSTNVKSTINLFGYNTYIK